MNKFIIIALLSLVLVGSAFAQAADPIAVQRAVTTVPLLRGMMKDPDSFVLEGVFQARGRYPKEFDRGLYIICYRYRARNGYGGYGSNVASQRWGLTPKGKKDLNGVLFFHDQTDNSVERLCEAKNIVVDMTAEVKVALAPPAPALPPAAPAESAEDKAKQAQQYADCLKLAVDNPKVVCKQ